MTGTKMNIKNNLVDAGCDSEFIAKFIDLSLGQNTSEMLKMLAIHRKTLLDNIHAEERKVYCLDYLINELK